MPTNLETIESEAAACGLSLRGGFSVTAEDSVPIFASGNKALSLVLLGNVGSSIWPEFSNSAELHDGLDNPLDRWSKRVGDALAASLGGVAYYPFGGPPYQPFIRWANKAETLQRSKLGILMHPEYGLWHAYRLAIALPDALFDQQAMRAKQPHVCDACETQPCYNACPVGAFANDQYDVNRCVIYLSDNPQAQCNDTGCMARISCPEASEHRYTQAHAAFHINQFVKTRLVALNNAINKDE